MKLKQETINELGIILKDEFNLNLRNKELNRFAYFLIGYFDLLLKRSQFGNHPVSLIDKANRKIEN